MVIGFVETEFTVSETDPGVSLELRVLEGMIAPELGSVVVNVLTTDGTATS